MLKASAHIVPAFSSICNFFLDRDQSFALYKLPNQTYKNFLSGTEITLSSNPDFSVCEPGFIVAPFLENQPIKIIKAEYFALDFENQTYSIPTGFDSFKESESHKTVFKYHTQPAEDYKSFIEKVSKAISTINTTGLDKVVLSRKKSLGEISNLDLNLVFDELCASYPSAFISIVYLSSLKQFWIGASPEILVSEDSQGVFRTVALAGTQSAIDKNGHDIAPINALWSHKEIEEQALVSRYIINCLKKIRVREYTETGPKTIKAGNLLHLRSLYSIDSKLINFSNLSTVMLNLLHPTSAVCGMPKELGLQLIGKLEGYSREYYSGYLGPVNINSESHLYVNLRTLKIENNIVYTYAGAGITEDSDPDKEWFETEIKMKTIGKIFEKF